MRNPALGRFRRLTSFAALALALAAPALPVVADPVPVKGKSGTVVEFEIVEVTKEGFRGTRSGTEAVILVKWEQVDLDWLKENQPDLHQKMIDAAAEPAPAPGASAPAEGGSDNQQDPLAVAKSVIAEWASQRVPPERQRNQGGGGRGGRRGNNQGGNNNRSNNSPPQPTILAFLSLLETSNEAGKDAYERLATDQDFRKRLVGKVESAVSQLRNLRTPENTRVVDPLISTGNTFVEAMTEIGSNPSQISRSAMSSVVRFLDRWQSVGEAK